MGTKLYVGNLPYTATEAELENLFSQAGDVVEVSIITDRETGRARGFGFIEMANDEAARAAIEQFDGAQMGGRTLKVNEAKPRQPREREYRGRY